MQTFTSPSPGALSRFAFSVREYNRVEQIFVSYTGSTSVHIFLAAAVDATVATKQ